MGVWGERFRTESSGRVGLDGFDKISQGMYILSSNFRALTLLISMVNIHNDC